MAIQHKDIAAIREDYTLSSLTEQEVLSDPLQQFGKWFEESLLSQVTEPNAMALSTINDAGFPASRVVILKHNNTDRLSFFNNYVSKNANDMAHNHEVRFRFFLPQ